MRIALLGGSFNPPHVGHMMNAYYVFLKFAKLRARNG